MRVSTVYAAVRVRSTILAMLPLKMGRHLPNGGREYFNHRLAPVLSRNPNRWQTSFQWRQMMQSHVILRGNGISEIVPGPRGFVDQLVPLHPDHVELKDQLRDGRLVYEYRPPGTGQLRRLTSDDVLHLMGPSTNGCWGLSVVNLMKDSVGLALATQEHGGRLFNNAPMMKGLIKQTAGRAMDEPAQKALANSFARAHSGANAHGVAYLPAGMEWQSIGMSNEDAQYLATREFQVADLLRFLSVPGVLVGHADKTSTYASAEQFFQSFFTVHLDPDFVMWEQAICRDLLEEGERETVFAEIVRGGLMRADAKSRAEFYRAMIELGVMTRNEARGLENLNPIEGLDDPLTPLNMERGAGRDTGRDTGRAPEATTSAAPVASTQMRSIVAATAARLVNKEVARMQHEALKYADNDALWRQSVTAWYERFASEVARDLSLPLPDATAYAVRRREEVLAVGVSVLEVWKAEAGGALVEQIMGDDSCAITH